MFIVLNPEFIRPMTIFLATEALKLPISPSLRNSYQILRIGLCAARHKAPVLPVSLVLSYYSSNIAQSEEWSSLELPLVGVQDCSPILHGLLGAREHGDQLNGALMLLRVVTVVNSRQCWEVTYLGMPLSLSKAASVPSPATITDPCSIGALGL